MLEGKIIVITGASSGIGYSTAIKAQELGATVVWASRSIESDANLISLLKNGSVVKNLDVSNESNVIDFFNFINAKFGKLDSLINCAGYVDPESMIATSYSNWNTTISINLTGTFLCSKYGVNIMKNSGGNIINVASTAGLTPRPGWSAYAAAKSGVISFSTAISEELSEYNIRVFIICPGRTATPLRRILAPSEDPRTIMQPETVAKVIINCLFDDHYPLEGQPIIVRERF